jgi:hypothetical protein
MKFYFKIFGVLGLLSTTLQANFNGGYIKGGCALIGVGVLKYTQPSQKNEDSTLSQENKKGTLKYARGGEATILSFTMGYGNVINDNGLYLGIELDARQDVCMSGLFPARLNLLGRIGWEATDNILPYAALGIGCTNIQGSKGNYYEAYPHLVSAVGVDIKLWDFVVIGPVLNFYVSVNDIQEFKYHVSAKAKLELQYSF